VNSPLDEPELVEETQFDATTEVEAIAAAQVRVSLTGKAAEWARLRGPNGSVPWYADGPFA
jgi:hypothetical protein